MTCINRGCDDNLFIDLPLPEAELKSFTITITQDSIPVIVRGMDECEVNNEVLKVPIHAAETLNLNTHRASVRMDYVTTEMIAHRTFESPFIVR